MQKIKKSLNNLLLLLSLFLGGTEKAMETPATTPNSSDKENNSIESFPVTAAAASSSRTEDESSAPSTPKASDQEEPSIESFSIKKEAATVDSKSKHLTKETESPQASAAAVDSSRTERESSPSATPAQQKTSLTKSETLGLEVLFGSNNTGDDTSPTETSNSPFAGAHKQKTKKSQQKQNTVFQNYIKFFFTAKHEKEVASVTSAAEAATNTGLMSEAFFSELTKAINKQLHGYQINENQAETLFNAIDENILKLGGFTSFSEFSDTLLKYWKVAGIQDSLIIKILENCMKQLSSESKEAYNERSQRGKGFAYELFVAPILEKKLLQTVTAFSITLPGKSSTGTPTDLEFDLCLNNTIFIECKNREFKYTDHREALEACKLADPKTKKDCYKEMYAKHSFYKEVESFNRHKIVAACNRKKYIVVFPVIPGSISKFNEQELSESITGCVEELASCEINWLVVPLVKEDTQHLQTDSSFKSYLKSKETKLDGIIEFIINVMKKMPKRLISSEKIAAEEEFSDEKLRLILSNLSTKEQLHNIKDFIKKNKENTPEYRKVLSWLGMLDTKQQSEAKQADKTAQKEKLKLKRLNAGNPAQKEKSPKNLALDFAAAAETSPSTEKDAAVSAASPAEKQKIYSRVNRLVQQFMPLSTQEILRSKL